jgi:hypothetical protein
MDRVTVDMLDDDYVAAEDEDVGPDLAHEPTEVGVRYLMGLGVAEMDARHLVAVAKGEIGSSGGQAAVRAVEPPR